MDNTIYFGDNLPILQKMKSESVDLIYIDPPFNTGQAPKPHPDQDRTFRNRATAPGLAATATRPSGWAAGSILDIFDDYLAFLEPRLVEAYRILSAHGTSVFPY